MIADLRSRSPSNVLQSTVLNELLTTVPPPLDSKVIQMFQAWEAFEEERR